MNSFPAFGCGAPASRPTTTSPASLGGVDSCRPACAASSVEYSAMIERGGDEDFRRGHRVGQLRRFMTTGLWAANLAVKSGPSVSSARVSSN